MRSFKRKMQSFFKIIMRTSLINRWIVFEIDLILCFLGFGLATYIQLRNTEMNISSTRMLVAGFVFILSTGFSFYILNPYKGLIRHSSFMEMWRLFASLFFSASLLYLYILLSGFSFEH